MPDRLRKERTGAVAIAGRAGSPAANRPRQYNYGKTIESTKSTEFELTQQTGEIATNSGGRAASTICF
jgi:hypothetical protein